MSMPRDFPFIDLFAGCGGFSLGLVQAGLDGVLAIEKSEDAFLTFKANFLEGPPEWRFDKWPEWLEPGPLDIKNVVDTYRDKLADELRDKVALIAGGPPCQGFSFAGRRKASDPRNQLFRSYVQMVDIIRPRMVVLENVPGMAVSHGKGSAGLNRSVGRPRHAFSDRVVDALRDIGYEADYRILVASEFGVPQARPRLFIIGVREDVGRAFADPVDTAFRYVLESRDQMLQALGLKQLVPAGDAISDLKTKIRNGRKGRPPVRTQPCTDSHSPPGFDDIVYAPVAPLTQYQRVMREGALPADPANSLRLARHRPAIRERFSLIQGMNLPKGVSLPMWVREQLKLQKHRIVVIDERRPAPTLTTLPDDLLHYDEPRILTVRETARLQSFPDRFRFLGKYTTGGSRRKRECPRYSQVGNAVAPFVARAIGLAVIRFLTDASDAKTLRKHGAPDAKGQFSLGLRGRN